MCKCVRFGGCVAVSVRVCVWGNCLCVYECVGLVGVWLLV